MSSSAAAVSYFEEGMVWNCEYYGTTEPQLTVSPYTVWLSDPCRIDGKDVVIMWHRDDTRPVSVCQIAYIYQEEERVYFKPYNSDNNIWYLAYDFALNEGEGETFYYLGGPGIDSAATDEPESYYVKCLKVIESEQIPGIKLMHMVETGESTSGFYTERTWIKGIGSTEGPLWNIPEPWCGMGSCIVSAVFKEEVIYHEHTANANAIDKETAVSIIPAAQEIRLHNNATTSVNVMLFDIKGQCLLRRLLQPQENYTHPVENGVYIAHYSNKSTKIFVKY